MNGYYLLEAVMLSVKITILNHCLGTIGFVNAAFEVKMQIDCNDAKVPNLIFLPCGSLGSIAGLLLGFALLGFNETKIYGVEIYSNNPNQRAQV